MSIYGIHFCRLCKCRFQVGFNVKPAVVLYQRFSTCLLSPASPSPCYYSCRVGFNTTLVIVCRKCFHCWDFNSAFHSIDRLSQVVHAGTCAVLDLQDICNPLVFIIWISTLDVIQMCGQHQLSSWWQTTSCEGTHKFCHVNTCAMLDSTWLM